MNDELTDELLKREVVRTMAHGDPAINRALQIVGQPINPVRVVGLDEIAELYKRMGDTGATDPKRRSQISGFRAPGDPTIYVSRESKEYKRASNEKDLPGHMLLAALLAHEDTHGPALDDEVAAKQKERDFLIDRLSKFKDYSDPSVKERQRALALSGRLATREAMKAGKAGQ